MMKHTPGPWKLEDAGYKFIISKPGNGYITRDVCRMDSSTMAAFEYEANARLISVAPELFQVCKMFLGAIRILNDGPDASDQSRADNMLAEAFKIAHEAISTVEGESK